MPLSDKQIKFIHKYLRRSVEFGKKARPMPSVSEFEKDFECAFGDCCETDHNHPVDHVIPGAEEPESA